MSRALRVELEALDELHEAAEWYEDKPAGLGVAFVEAIDRTLVRIRELPSSFPLIMQHPPVQRALVRKFPYAVVFITPRRHSRDRVPTCQAPAALLGAPHHLGRDVTMVAVA